VADCAALSELMSRRLDDLVERGLDPEQAIVFVIDGGRRCAGRMAFGRLTRVYGTHAVPGQTWTLVMFALKALSEAVELSIRQSCSLLTEK
jgi:hypothetical protein